MRVFIAAFLMCALAPAQELKIQTATLANGLKILVQEDHGIPNVAMYFFYRIGSRNERPGITGISHFFEHMMFNGAKKYGPHQFDFEMEKAGGYNNASTGIDLTTYTDWFPSSALDLMMDMEGDRMQNLSFDPKMIESERGVVYSERRTSVDNSNFGALYEQLNAAAFVAHPYHSPVVGWPSDIESWTVDDLKNHYRMGYAPNNCTMVVVGDVTMAHVMELAKKYIEPIPREAPPPPIRTKEPAQQGERRVVLRKAAQLPLLMIAYHTPEATNPDIPALDVLETLLVRGQSSRLYHRLIDHDQLAIAVQAQRRNSLDPYLMLFMIQPRNGVDPVKAEHATYEELDRLKSVEVPAEELEKARNQILATLYREEKTIAGRANLLGEYEVFFGSYTKLFQVERDVNAVTAADVQRVAKKYLGENNRTVATLIPEGK